jgi:hypothetical protein
MMAKKLFKMKFLYPMLWLVKTPTAAIQYYALSGLHVNILLNHRASPDAGMFCPFRAFLNSHLNHSINLKRPS